VTVLKQLFLSCRFRSVYRQEVIVWFLPYSQRVMIVKL